MTTTKLYEYQNGSYAVSIFSDGTKIREGDTFKPEYPESIDVKITDYCDLGCKYCHEQSTEYGIHSELELLLNLVKGCPAGVELAIGGGNPLSHPDIYEVFKELAVRGIVLNLTVNQEHLLNANYFHLLKCLIRENIIKGVGISITDNVYRVARQIDELYSRTNNIVFHVIAGINEISVLQSLQEIKQDYKVLILGYKEFGRGEKFFEIRSKSIHLNIQQWIKDLPDYIKDENIISFDNLAIKQLKIRRLFSAREWDKFYMGDDGSYTFYIDLVNQEYARSSTTNKRNKLLGTNIEMFRNIRDEINSNNFVAVMI